MLDYKMNLVFGLDLLCSTKLAIALVCLEWKESFSLQSITATSFPHILKIDLFHNIIRWFNYSLLTDTFQRNKTVRHLNSCLISS